MATNFPTSIDALVNPTATDSLATVNHADQHTNANDAIEALEAKVGVNNSAVTTSLDYRVANVEGNKIPLVWRTGGYQRTPWGTPFQSTLAMIGNRMYATALYVPRGASIDRVGLEVTTVGSAGSVVRMGLYANGSNAVGGLLFDAGTVDTASSTGYKEITVSWTNLTGDIYWLVACAQVGGTPPTVRIPGTNTHFTGSLGPYNIGLNTNPDRWSVIQNAGVTGALPSTFTMGIQETGPVMIVRAG